MNNEKSPMDRLESLTYKIKVNRYLIEYAEEWTGDKCNLNTPDDPDMPTSLKLADRTFLRYNMGRWLKIIGQATEDMIALEEELMDIRRVIALEKRGEIHE